MTKEELDSRIAAQQDRLTKRGDPPAPKHVHRWGTAYKSSSGRRVCVDCGYVTQPGETGWDAWEKRAGGQP